MIARHPVAINPVTGSICLAMTILNLDAGNCGYAVVLALAAGAAYGAAYSIWTLQRAVT